MISNVDSGNQSDTEYHNRMTRMDPMGLPAATPETEEKCASVDAEVCWHNDHGQKGATSSSMPQLYTGTTTTSEKTIPPLSNAAPTPQMAAIVPHSSNSNTQDNSNSTCIERNTAASTRRSLQASVSNAMHKLSSGGKSSNNSGVKSGVSETTATGRGGKCLLPLSAGSAVTPVRESGAKSTSPPLAGKAGAPLDASVFTSPSQVTDGTSSSTSKPHSQTSNSSRKRYVDVFDPEFKVQWSVPKDLVAHHPPDRMNITRLVQCRNYRKGEIESCQMGMKCKFVHIDADCNSLPAKPVHINYIWWTEKKCVYRRLPRGAFDPQTGKALPLTEEERVRQEAKEAEKKRKREERREKRHQQKLRDLEELEAQLAEEKQAKENINDLPLEKMDETNHHVASESTLNAEVVGNEALLKTESADLVYKTQTEGNSLDSTTIVDWRESSTPPGSSHDDHTGQTTTTVVDKLSGSAAEALQEGTALPSAAPPALPRKNFVVLSVPESDLRDDPSDVDDDDDVQVISVRTVEDELLFVRQDCLLVTAGSLKIARRKQQEKGELTSPLEPLSICEEYQKQATCCFGEGCEKVHPVVVDPSVLDEFKRVGKRVQWYSDRHHRVRIKTVEVPLPPPAAASSSSPSINQHQQPNVNKNTHSSTNTNKAGSGDKARHSNNNNNNKNTNSSSHSPAIAGPNSAPNANHPHHHPHHHQMTNGMGIGGGFVNGSMSYGFHPSPGAGARGGGARVLPARMEHHSQQQQQQQQPSYRLLPHQPMHHQPLHGIPAGMSVSLTTPPHATPPPPWSFDEDHRQGQSHGGPTMSMMASMAAAPPPIITFLPNAVQSANGEEFSSSLTDQAQSYAKGTIPPSGGAPPPLYHSLVPTSGAGAPFSAPTGPHLATTAILGSLPPSHVPMSMGTYGYAAPVQGSASAVVGLPGQVSPYPSSTTQHQTWTYQAPAYSFTQLPTTTTTSNNNNNTPQQQQAVVTDSVFAVPSTSSLPPSAAAAAAVSLVSPSPSPATVEAGAAAAAAAAAEMFYLSNGFSPARASAAAKATASHVVPPSLANPNSAGAMLLPMLSSTHSGLVVPPPSQSQLSSGPTTTATATSLLGENLTQMHPLFFVNGGDLAAPPSASAPQSQTTDGVTTGSVPPSASPSSRSVLAPDDHPSAAAAPSPATLFPGSMGGEETPFLWPMACESDSTGLGMDQGPRSPNGMTYLSMPDESQLQFNSGFNFSS